MSLAVPRQLRRQLTPVTRALAPLLDTGVLTRDGHLLADLTCRATVQAARRAITARNAVYVAWDVRGCCRYVGSVCRRSSAAVADRLGEHHQHLVEGLARRGGWVLLTVLPIRADAPPSIVRAAEGWAARFLAPLDGTAHPRIDRTAARCTRRAPGGVGLLPAYFRPNGGQEVGQGPGFGSSSAETRPYRHRRPGFTGGGGFSPGMAAQAQARG